MLPDLLNIILLFIYNQNKYTRPKLVQFDLFRPMFRNTNKLQFCFLLLEGIHRMVTQCL